MAPKWHFRLQMTLFATLAEQGATWVAKRYFLSAAPKVDLPFSTSTCPATLLNKGEIRYCPKNLTCRAGQVRVLFSLPHCRFFAEFTCNLQLHGQWLCCTLWRQLWRQAPQRGRRIFKAQAGSVNLWCWYWWCE